MITARSFVGSPEMNLLEGQLMGGCFILGHRATNLPADLARSLPQGPVALGFRPEHAKLNASGVGIEFESTLRWIERLGHENHALLDISGFRVTCAIEGRQALSSELLTRIRIPWEECHWFGSSGERLPSPIGKRAA